MIKTFISQLLRKLHVLYYFDYIFFYYQKIKNYKSNKEFKKQYPKIPIPPDYLIFESFQLNYKKYFDSYKTAEHLIKEFSLYKKIESLNILDWGCGPGRVIRHFPSILGNTCFYYATDYNQQSIEWCKKNLSNINFFCNTIEPKLPYEENFFDIIYSISVFTHLSEEMHYRWFNEIYRVLKPGGIFYTTTHGENYKKKLSKNEKEKFDQGLFISREKVKVGHRTYTAFQPKQFMYNLFKKVTILKHEEIIQTSRWLPQDIWIIQK